ncbi:hypothetical protein OCK74_00310 [Chitinophagaceae bacterium LB-8]|uniref:Uncharacterized protein n=1 Tax=Paraflavisolibacter caeni TaxID=2982496 RepID=A0A9X2XMZ1_9BACT|nr:hypothetical protein [Paraflavisolibacter caeni]MCU7547529.1 hypothetical protein [Paraflavisolibacter caeni]
MAKKRSNRVSTPPPPDGSQYILVKTKEGSFWRRKRGSVKPAPVNDVLARNAEASKVTGPAAKRIVDKLRPYLRGLRTGRLTVRVIGALRKALNRKGIIDFTFLDGMELQPEHPFNKLVLDPYKVEQADRSLHISIPIGKGRVKQLNGIVTDYYFEAIVVQGDATKDSGLRVDSVESKVYSIEADQKLCELSVDLPAQKGPWMLLLKISSLEGNEMAVHPRHYAMKVVKTGE